MAEVASGGPKPYHYCPKSLIGEGNHRGKGDVRVVWCARYLENGINPAGQNHGVERAGDPPGGANATPSAVVPRFREKWCVRVAPQRKNPIRLE